MVWRIVVASLFAALKSVPDALQCSLQEMEAPVAVYHQSKSGRNKSIEIDHRKANRLIDTTRK